MKDKLYITILSISNIIQSALLICTTFLFKIVIDEAVLISNGKTDNSILITYIIITISTVLLLAILRIIHLFIRNKYNLMLEVLLKGEIFNAVMNKKFEEVKDVHSATLSNIYLSDTIHIMEARSFYIPNLFLHFSRLIFAFIALLILRWEVVVILSVLGILLFGLVYIYGKYSKRLNKRALESDDILNCHMQESIENIKLVKVLSNKETIKYNIDEKLNQNYSCKNKRNKLNIFANGLLSTAVNILYALTLCYSAYLIATGKVTYGTLTALVSLVSYFESPFTALSQSLNRLYQSKASKERINTLLSKKDEIEDYKLKDFDKIVFNNMSFSYNDNIIYSNFNYEINKNDIIYIKGDSGKGKTTLLNILMGFIEYKGDILVYSNNKEYKISEATRSLFSYVPQENILFSGTIKSNFKMFYKDITDEEIISSLKACHIYDEIEKLEGNINYKIYERGRGLSIGQIQRILIAIAYAAKRPIIIMDEFSSALDKENETKICELLKTLNKTIIMVSHRDIDVDGKILKVGLTNDN